MRKRKRNRKKKKFLPLLLPALLTVLCFFLLEKSLLPPLKEISHMQCKAAANRIIDEAAANALARMELDASALLQKGADGESYTANTAAAIDATPKAQAAEYYRILCLYADVYRGCS